MTEFFISTIAAFILGLLTFIALTLNSMNHDLFKIKQILDNYEQKQTESHKNEYVETRKNARYNERNVRRY